MISVDTMINYIDWKIMFIVPTGVSDKQFGSVISSNQNASQGYSASHNVVTL